MKRLYILLLVLIMFSPAMFVGCNSSSAKVFPHEEARKVYSHGIPDSATNVQILENRWVAFDWNIHGKNRHFIGRDIGGREGILIEIKD